MDQNDFFFSVSVCVYFKHSFAVQLTGDYFPKANDDTVSIWEDESIAIDALANDYFAGDNASIVEFSKVRYVVNLFYMLILSF